jgi:aspartate aminotransferase
MAAFDADSHANKVSLITGAYRDEEGQPWVLPSVRQVSDCLGMQDVDEINSNRRNPVSLTPIMNI